MNRAARWVLAAALALPLAARAAEDLQLRFDPGLRDVIVAAAAKSQASMAVEVYRLTDQGVITALQKAAQRGVKVRVILCPSGQQNRRPAEQLSKAGAEVRWYPLTHPDQLMHVKMGIVDSRRLLLGSANWTHWGLTLHHETLLDVKAPETVEQAVRQFESDWKKSAPHR